MRKPLSGSWKSGTRMDLDLNFLGVEKDKHDNDKILEELSDTSTNRGRLIMVRDYNLHRDFGLIQRVLQDGHDNDKILEIVVEINIEILGDFRGW